MRLARLLTFAAFLGAAGPALAQDAAVLGGHLFAAGGAVRAIDGAEDDAFLAGGTVYTAGAFRESLFVTGGTLTVTGSAGRNLYVAGGTVAAEGNTAEDLFAAAGTFRLREGAKVGGDAFVTGGTVEIFGDITGDLWVAGGTVVLTGNVAGSVHARASSLEVTPRARIGGTLEYRAANGANISPAAQIAGGTRVLPVPDREEDNELDVADRAGWSIGTVIGLTIMAALLQLAVPGLASDAAELIGERPLRGFGWGLVALVGLPFAGLLMLLTILGIPLGLLFWLVFALLLAAGTVTGAYWLGLRIRALFESALEEPAFGGRVGWTLAGFVALAVIEWVPYLGPLFVAALEITAVGALLTAIWWRVRGPRPVTAGI